MKFLKSLFIGATLLFGMVAASQAQSESTVIIYVVGDLPISVPALAAGEVGSKPLTLGSATFNLDGSNSEATGDGSLVAYTWSDGITTQTGLAVSFTYTTTGTRVITLQVTDNYGNVAAAEISVTVIGTGDLSVTPAINKAVECDGMGNLAEFDCWLSTHGGSVATGSAPPISWTDNYTGNAMWVLGACPIDEQVTVTFTATDANGVTASTTATFQIKDTTAPPLNWCLNGAPVADYTIQTIPVASFPVVIKVKPNDICSSSTLQKSFSFLQGSATVTYSSSVGGTVNDTVTISSPSPTAKVRVYFKATDHCGNASAIEWVEVDAIKTVKLKGNEGVGNGVDPDTPGALHNGNNDAPGFFPGNPGAKHKPR